MRSPLMSQDSSLRLRRTLPGRAAFVNKLLTFTRGNGLHARPRPGVAGSLPRCYPARMTAKAAAAVAFAIAIAVAQAATRGVHLPP
ncbi:MAG TPA: hypothetical protein VLI93_01330, partial [Acetobacteraceae bacterium]|nr:hypothetical protein [Acetobacteraceae bacterium]